MGFEALFLSMMTDTVLMRSASGHDDYGQPAWGAWETVRARVVYEDKGRRGTGDDALDYTAVVYLPPTPEVGALAEIKLPDASVRQVVDCKRPSDEDGVHHQKVWVS